MVSVFALHSGTVTQLVGGGQKAGSDAGVNMSGTPGLAAMTGVCRVVHKRSLVVVVMQ